MNLAPNSNSILVNRVTFRIEKKIMSDIVVDLNMNDKIWKFTFERKKQV